MKDNTLYNKNTAKQFYEDRYEAGYMDEWPAEKKQRVFEVIRMLPLPAAGKALDFGCGNGVFTAVLKQALPGWDVWGCDISAVAVENARKRYPDCHFFVSDNDVRQDQQFDFLFSHHVLEHVFDIRKIMQEMDDLLKPEASMLHILPCGNEGSLEHQICRHRIGGINASMENRFFYEDEGHVRRLTTKGLADLMATHGFRLSKDYYSNQHAGAIKWISQSTPELIRMITDPSRATTDHGKAFLSGLQEQLLSLYEKQVSAREYQQIRDKSGKSLRDRAAMAKRYLNYRSSLAVLDKVNGDAEEEWKHNKSNPAGSEMYLLFTREAGGAI